MSGVCIGGDDNVGNYDNGNNDDIGGNTLH
jgi:hypothetical protein